MPALYRSIVFFLLFLSTWGWTCQATAEELSPKDIAARLQKTYEESTSLNAKFRQVTTMALTGKERLGFGTLVFMKPGLMRWDYIEPERQVLISDGDEISMYFANSNQMLITSAREYLQSDVSYAFFAGTGDVLRDFEAVRPEGQPEVAADEYAIELVPRQPHPQISRLYVQAARDTFLITRLRIVDHFDTVTDLYFEEIHLNVLAGADPQTIAELFSFIPPPGTEIIEQ